MSKSPPIKDASELLFGPRRSGRGSQRPDPDRLKHAVYVPNVGNTGLASDLVDLAEIAWNCGWDGFFIWDHLVFGCLNTADPAVTLGAIAQSARSWRPQGELKPQSLFTIGVLVTPVPRRRAWKLAKEIATVSAMLEESNKELFKALDKRHTIELIWGFGLGVEEDYRVTGEPEQSLSERAVQLDSGINLIGRLFDGEERDFQPPPKPRTKLWSALSWTDGKKLADHPPGPIERAAGLDGVFPVPLPWPDSWTRSSELAPDQIKELHARITESQEAQGMEAGESQIDIAACGQSDRVDPNDERERKAAYREAGLTWWLELVQPEDSLRSTKKWIKAGPVKDS